ncbi:MAG: glycosyltransferase family 39 protein [Deltaproteobacteria bacterium]|nr:glycosyltransferase family 39 protein [Deltaproteobacteria bacterium]
MQNQTSTAAKDLLAVLALFAAALAVKGMIVAADRVINPDGAIYIAAAEQLARGHFRASLAIYPMPFFPFLLALSHWLIPDWIRAGQALSTISFALILPPLFFLARDLFDRQAALAAGLLYLTLPVFNLPSADILREPPFLLCMITAVWAGCRALASGQLRYFAVFTLSALLAVLCRLEGLLMPAAFLLAWAVACRRQPAARPALLQGGLLLLVFPLALAATWWLGKVCAWPNFNRLEEIGARLGLEGGGHGFLYTYQLVTGSMKKLQQTLPGGRLANNLLEVSRHYAPLIYLLGMAEMFAKAVFPTTLILVAGQLFSRSRIRPPARLFLALLLGGYLVFILLLNVNQNFIVERLFLLPVLLVLPLAGRTLAAWGRHCREKRKTVLLVAVGLVFLGLPLGKTIQKTGGEETVLITAGHWLRDYGQQHQFVPAYNDPRLPFYAGRLEEIATCNPRNRELISQLSPQVDFLGFHLAKRKAASLPPIDGFVVQRRFTGRRHEVLFFSRSSRPSSPDAK